MLHYLGTDCGRQIAHTNPHDLDVVTVTASSQESELGPASVVSRSPIRFATKSQPKQWIQIVFNQVRR